MAGHTDSNAAQGEPVIDAFINLSRSLRWKDVAATTQANVRRELLDWTGAAIAGRHARGIPGWLQVLIDLGGRPDARVLGGPMVPAPTAALCNGYYGHVLEFDDTHDEAVLHAGSATIPAAFAAAGLRGSVSGAEFCEAILLGIELTCRLGMGTRLNLVESGWIYTAIFGHFGATLAAARIIDPRPEVLRNAQGIVYCLTSGNHESTREGKATKHVQPGFAAANAITASLMACRNLDGIQQPISGEDGLARVYLHGKFDSDRALDRLGDFYEFDRLSIKPYPTCRLTHPAISAALELYGLLGEDVKHIERVELVVGPQAHDVVGRDAPERRSPGQPVNAQFSIYWCVAVALAYGEVTPIQLETEIPPSPGIAALIARVSCRAGDTASRDVGGCTLRVHGPFGINEITHANARGHPDFPLSDAELLAKFRANLRYAGVADAIAGDLAEGILAIDTLADVRPLADDIASAAAGTASH